MSLKMVIRCDICNRDLPPRETVSAPAEDLDDLEIKFQFETNHSIPVVVVHARDACWDCRRYFVQEITAAVDRLRAHSL